MATKEFTAVEWLGQLHYQICNGGMAQACFNGYIDDLIEAYGSVDDWANALKHELGDTEAGRKATEAAQFIVKGVDGISLSKSCPDCDGSGYLQYEEEDEDGETVTVEETCCECNGSGIIDVDRYADVDFEHFGVDNWDHEYYTLVDSDLIGRMQKAMSNQNVAKATKEINDAGKIHYSRKQEKKRT